MASKITKEQIKTYFDAWRGIMADRELRPASKVVLWAIQDTNFDTFFMSQNNLAKKLNYKRPAVTRAIQELERKKKITVNRPPHGSHKTLKIELSEELKPFFIREKKKSLTLQKEHDMLQKEHEENSKTSLSRYKSNTNDINDTKLTISPNSEDISTITAEHNGEGEGVVPPKSKLPYPTLYLSPQEIAEVKSSLPAWVTEEIINLKNSEYFNKKGQKKRSRRAHLDGLSNWIRIAINNKWLTKPQENKILVATTKGGGVE